MSHARTAAGAFRARQARARQMVAAGTISADEAEAHLAPWLAIACLAGANLPEISDRLAEFHHVAGSPSPESMLRAIIAEQLDPERRWCRLLVRAKDDAVGKAHDAASIADARALLALTRALGTDRPILPARSGQRGAAGTAGEWSSLQRENAA